MLPYYGANEDANVLQAYLLGIEPEFCRIDVGYRNCRYDAAPEKYHGVRYGWDHDTRSCRKRERMKKVVEGQGCRINASKIEILFLKSGNAGV